MIHEKHTRERYLADALFLLRRHRTLAALARDRRVSIRPLHPSPSALTAGEDALKSPPATRIRIASAADVLQRS